MRFALHPIEPLAGLGGGGRMGNVELNPGGGVGRSMSLSSPTLLPLLRAPSLQPPIGELARLRVLVDDRAEGLERLVVTTGHVIALAQPVLRIVGQCAVRKGHEELLERAGRLLIL